MKIGDTIRRWLEEEGFYVRELKDPKAEFNIEAKHANGLSVNVLKPKGPTEVVLVVSKLIPAGRIREAISVMSARELEWLKDELVLRILSMPEVLAYIDGKLRHIVIQVPVFLEELSKPKIIRGVYSVLKALNVATIVMKRATGGGVDE